MIMININSENIAETMEKIVLTNTRKDPKALFSFIVFVFCMIKYLIFNVFELLPLYGKINKSISLFILSPLTLIALLLSITTLIISIKDLKNNIFNIILSLPILLEIYYFFFYL